MKKLIIIGLWLLLTAINPVLFFIYLILLLTFKYHKIILMPLPLILIAYTWYKIETPFWYLKLRWQNWQCQISSALKQRLFSLWNASL